MLFGSDYPMWTPKEAVDGVREIAANRIEGMPAISQELLDQLLQGDQRERLGL
jgi:predicted TIM-barrel fold metal-dependent hydrolase